MISYGKQTLDQSDFDKVLQVLKSEWLTQGPMIKEFEEAFANYCECKYAVAVANGTAALHLSYLAMGLKKGQSIITTPNTFLATANAALYCNADVKFVDINPETFNLDEQKLIIERTDNVVGIVPVHFGGLPCDMEKISQFAKTNKLWIIEDACHALGGKYKNDKKVGSCCYSDATVFSFHPVKQMTTGEGGMICTNDEQLYKKLLQLRTHGVTRNQDELIENHGPWYYEMQHLGYNYRITDFQAGLGLSQLNHIDEWVLKRAELVKRYDQSFESVSSIKHQYHPANQEISYHLYVVRAENRKKLFEYLVNNGIKPQVHYIPVHLQPYYRKKFRFKEGCYKNAEDYYIEAISLPLYPTLTFEEQDYIISCVKTFYEVS